MSNRLGFIVSADIRTLFKSVPFDDRCTPAKTENRAFDYEVRAITDECSRPVCEMGEAEEKC